MVQLPCKVALINHNILMQKEVIDKFNEFQRICLKGSEDLLVAALASLEKGLDHIAFHLTALALEEIGKVDLVWMAAMIEDKPSEREINLDIDDHEKKLFWAVWGPSFGRQKITKEQIEQLQGMARNIHSRRMDYLYADPTKPQLGQQKMQPGEAKAFYEFVEARLKLAQATGEKRDVPAEESGDLEWFFKATSDPEKRNQIFGHTSQDKLLELGDVKEWVKWLRNLYNERDKEMRALLEAELKRERPSDEEAEKPKWNVRVKLMTPTHAIRNKALSEFNKGSHYIKLFAGTKNTLFVEQLFPSAVPIGALWEHAWFLHRLFAVSLCVGTRGIFWWHFPADHTKYYERIEDLEKRVEVRVEINPALRINWKDLHWTLGPSELSMTSLAFGYLSHLWTSRKQGTLDAYAAGMSLLAKNDVHLRLEPNAIERFYGCLQQAMIDSGDWDGASDFKAAACSQLNDVLKTTKELEETLDMAEEVKTKHASTEPVTITNVVAMKLYCDLYLIKQAMKYAEKKTGAKMRLVVEAEGGEKAIESQTPAGPQPETHSSPPPVGH